MNARKKIYNLLRFYGEPEGKIDEMLNELCKEQRAKDKQEIDKKLNATDVGSKYWAIDVVNDYFDNASE